MNPLSIIGSAAGIAGVAGLTFLIHQAFVGFTGLVEDRAIARVEAALAQQAREYETKMRNNADAAEDRHEAEMAQWEAERESYEARIEGLFDDLEERSRANAEAVDVDLVREFAVSLCKVKAGRDQGAREACDIRASKADFTRRAPIFALTRERAEGWATVCEQTGEELYCDWAIPAITGTTLRELLDWVKDADAALIAYDANQDILTEQIDQIRNMPEPEIQQ